MNFFNKFMLAIVDVFWVNLSYIISINIVDYGDTASYISAYKQDALVVSIIYLLCFYFLKLYDSLWTSAGIDEFLMGVGASILGGGISSIYSRYFGEWLPLNVIIVAITFAMITTLGFRVLFRLYRRGVISMSNKELENFQKVMIVGAGSAGVMILKEMLDRKELKYNPVAIIDDSPSKLGKKIFGVKVMGNRYDIHKIVEEQEIEIILIAIPSIDNKNKSEIIDICKDTGCKLKIIPGMYEILSGKAKVSNIKDIDLEDLLGREPIILDNKGISDYLTDKVVLVTGGGGSIGSELCRQIAKYEPKMLIILDIYENNAYDIQNELKYRYDKLNLNVLIASVRDRSRIESIFEEYKPQVVFHAAAHKHVPLMEDSPMEAIKNNVFGTLNLAECADKYNVEKFVLISTDKAVNPTSVMGTTKRICEMIVQAMDKKSKTEFVAVRFGNVLGSNGSVIPLFKRQIAHGGPVTVTDKNITRFFMLIPEAAQLVLQAGAFAQGGEIFVLDMGKPVRIYDLACDLIRLSGFEPGRDIKIEITGLRPGEKLYEEILMNEEGLQKTGHNKIFIGKPTFEDMDKLKEKLDELKPLIEANDSEALKLELKELVPTYKAQDSEEVSITSED